MTMPSKPASGYVDPTDDVAMGCAAWQRIRERGERSFDDWVAVGKALAIGRAHCLKLANTNRPFGKVFTRAMAHWLSANGLADVQQQERYWSLQVVDNIDAVMAWRAGLDEGSRRRWNHPQSTWMHWRRSIGATASRHIEAVRSTIRPQGNGRPIYWDQASIRRAADALREAHSRDLFVLARVALEAAIRSDADLIALLDQPRPASKHHRPAASPAMIPA